MNGSTIGPSPATTNGTWCRHEPADEMYIAAETIELRYQHRAFGPARCGERIGEFRPAVQGVGALAGLDLRALGDDLDALDLGEAADGFLLGLDPQPGAALARPAYPIICDSLRHRTAPLNRYIISLPPVC